MATGRWSSSYCMSVLCYKVMLIQSCDRENWLALLPSATKLRQGNILRSICQEFCPRGRGVCLSECWDTPPGQTPLHLGRHPPGQTPPLADTPSGQTPLLGRHTPPPTADGYFSGRYASYWNAFLYYVETSHCNLCGNLNGNNKT